MGRDKNGIGNLGVKELTCTTHGYELRVGGIGVIGTRNKKHKW